MRPLLGTIIGLASTLLYGLLSGFLLIRAAAQRDGGVVDLSNQVIGIVPPSFPVLAYLALTTAGFALLYLFSLIPRDSSLLVATLTAAIMSGVLIVAASWVIDSTRAFGPQVVPFEMGWLGWVQWGGRSPALHLVMFLLCGFLIYTLRARSRVRNSSAVHKSPEEVVSTA